MPASVVDIQVELIAHATEDLDKVLEAARAIFPPEVRDKVKFKMKSYKGHHGNPITFLRARVRDRDLAKAILAYIGSRLDEASREELGRGLGRRLSGGSLFIRLDKQWASLGQLRLCASDPIWIKVRFSSSKLADIIQACREAGLIP